MIKPESLWGLFKSCDDSKWLGDICRALGRQDVQLDYGQRAMLRTIEQDSAWMDERIEGQKARWAERQREKRARDKKKSADVTVTHECHGDIGDIGGVTVTHECHGDIGDIGGVTVTHECHGDIGDIGGVTVTHECHGDIGDNPNVTIHPSIQPTIHPSNQPNNNINNNRSVTVKGKNGNDDGTEDLKKEVDRFKVAVRQDEAGNDIYNPQFSAVAICAALTGDIASHRRWRKCVNSLGEDQVREECYTFYRELRAGEKPANRGAALNARLKRLGA